MPITWKAALAAPFLLSAAPEREPDFVTYPGVVQVICDKSLGTAFRVGPHKLLSVTHVTGNTGCKVEGEPLRTSYEGKDQDFSVLATDRRGRDFLRINCGGLSASEWYWAVGYARGWPKQQRVILRATGALSPQGFAILTGAETVIPGMSGGPVFNSAGEVVATVNAYNPFWRTSFVRVLKDTAVCGGDLA